VERIAFFSDAVFAIAMTLLVVQLSVPSGPAGDLGHALRSRGSKSFAFGLTFLVIGQYWLAHHRVFRHIRRYDLGLLWLNLVYLLGIAFLPFPSAAALLNVRLAVLCWAVLLPLTRLFLSVWIQ
jgi:uncharacterized membrane protein